MVSEEWAEALLEWSVELQGVWTRVAVWRRVWSAGTALTAMRRMQGLRRRLIELARSWAWWLVGRAKAAEVTRRCDALLGSV
jgi:hypothetical protein